MRLVLSLLIRHPVLLFYSSRGSPPDLFSLLARLLPHPLAECLFQRLPSLILSVQWSWNLPSLLERSRMNLREHIRHKWENRRYLKGSKPVHLLLLLLLRPLQWLKQMAHHLGLSRVLEAEDLLPKAARDSMSYPPVAADWDMFRETSPTNWMSRRALKSQGHLLDQPRTPNSITWLPLLSRDHNPYHICKTCLENFWNSDSFHLGAAVAFLADWGHICVFYYQMVVQPASRPSDSRTGKIVWSRALPVDVLSIRISLIKADIVVAELTWMTGYRTAVAYALLAAICSYISSIRAFFGPRRT